MTPAFAISIDGQPITTRLSSRLIELNVQDEAGLKSDAFDIKLDNKDWAIPRPPKGAKASISLGYEETGLQPMGEYVVDESSVGGDPALWITVRGKAADMTGAKGVGKTKRTKTYDQKTIEDIVKDVCGRAKLSPIVDPALASKKIDHVDQQNESDYHFLTRLAEENGAVFKPVQGKGVFAMRDNVKTLSGKPTQTVTIDLNSGEVKSGWSIEWQDRSKYNEVKAKYHDYKLGKTVVVSSKDGEEVDETEDKDGEGTSRTLSKKFRDKDTALAAAKAEADRLKRGTGTGKMTLVGDTRFVAESRLVLVNFGPDAGAGSWKIKSAKHSMTTNGFETSIDFETPKDADDKDDKK